MNENPRSEDERLRRLLDDAVSDVEPRDTLDLIRARTAATPFRSRRPWIMGAGAAVVATAATVAAVAVMGGNPGTTNAQDPGFAGPSTTVTSAGNPNETPSSQPSTPDESPSTAAEETVTVPVYYVGDTSRGPRLFREFHRVDVPEGDAVAQVSAALQEAVSGSAIDEDYGSDWPAGTTAEVQSGTGTPDVISILLSNDSTNLRERPSSMSEEQAAIAVEQLIYTAQAASQTRAPVQFLIERAGSPDNRTDMVLGRPASEPLAEGASLDVLAGVWIIEPAEGAEIKSGFEVTGLAEGAFEANVQWELMQGDTVVESGFITAADAFSRSAFSFTLKAPPGDYTLVVHDTDPSDGEGFAPWQDTKNITIVE